MMIKRFLEKKEFGCPDMLRYQFTNEFNIPISRECCRKMKKEPRKKWAKQNGKSITITGMRAEEGGTRANIKGCIITDKNGKLKKFHPLVKVTNEWEEWFIKQYKIKLANLYYEPYNFERTGKERTLHLTRISNDDSDDTVHPGTDTVTIVTE